MPQSRRFLFVDDQPQALEHLRRTLRSMRHEWEVAFAESGQEALDLLAARSFDVVVADVRMPAMDGAEWRQRCQEIKLEDLVL